MVAPDCLDPSSALRQDIASEAWRWRTPRLKGQRNHRVNVHGVADALGLELRYRPLPQLGGLMVGPELVAINSLASDPRRRFILAHEIGHVLVSRGAFECPDEVEEWACDWFARDLLAPLRLLPGRVDDTRALARSYGIPRDELEAQLAAREQAVGSQSGATVCARCGTRQRASCACAAVPLDCDPVACVESK